jgi:hypothetical protein
VAVEAEAPVPTLHLGSELPSVPGLLAQWGAGLSLEDVEARWTRSWTLPEAEGRTMRSEAVQALALVLEARIATRDLEAEVHRVEKALERISIAVEGRELGTLEGPVADASRAAERAASALERGDRAGSLRWSLEASDHLRRATPEVLARTLIREAEALLESAREESAHEASAPEAVGEAVEKAQPGRNPTAASYSEETRDRVRRLLVGAKDALDSGEPARALRRAWYAVGLLHAQIDGPEGRGTDEPQEGGP